MEVTPGTGELRIHPGAAPGVGTTYAMLGEARRGLGRGTGVEQDGLFTAFQRPGDRSAGVGLGLSVARGPTAAMGGTLTAEDTPGGGLTAVVSLPVSLPVAVALG